MDDEQQVCEQTAVLLEKIKICAEWRLSGAEAVERVKETHREDGISTCALLIGKCRIWMAWK